MERIQVTVDDTVSGDSDDAYDIMLRFQSFHEWWPQGLPVDCIKWKEGFVNSKVSIKPYPFIKVGWKLHSYSPGREIIIHYYEGMHTGTGVWTFTEGDSCTHVSFEIDILPKNRIYALAYKLFNVRKTHIRQVKEVIAALGKQLEKQHQGSLEAKGTSSTS